MNETTYMLKYVCRNAIAMKKENTNLKERKVKYKEGLGGRKGKTEMQNIIISLINNRKNNTH